MISTWIECQKCGNRLQEGRKLLFYSQTTFLGWDRMAMMDSEEIFFYDERVVCGTCILRYYRSCAVFSFCRESYLRVLTDVRGQISGFPFLRLLSCDVSPPILISDSIVSPPHHCSFLLYSNAPPTDGTAVTSCSS